jgi:hypothetical protein
MISVVCRGEAWRETEGKGAGEGHLPDTHDVHALGSDLGHRRGTTRLEQSLLDMYVSATAGGALLVSVRSGGKERGRGWREGW